MNMTCSRVLSLIGTLQHLTPDEFADASGHVFACKACRDVVISHYRQKTPTTELVEEMKKQRREVVVRIAH